MTLHNDGNWPRAGSIFQPDIKDAEIALVGVGASKSAITPNKADKTPDAIREALLRYSTYKISRNINIESLKAGDFGNVSQPDNQQQTISDLTKHFSQSKTIVLLGGDNSITYSGVSALANTVGGFSQVGLITLDAHFDVRDGISNGSPIRQLIEDGLPGSQVVQIGISDFANSEFYAERVKSYGIRVITRHECEGKSAKAIADDALAALSHCTYIYVDIDIDVCDRSVVPAAPAAVPGGFTAHELREIVFLLASSSRVNTFDITEIDATIDAPDQRTLRLAALCVLEIAAAKIGKKND
jgi:formimidoylglutamase